MTALRLTAAGALLALAGAVFVACAPSAGDPSTALPTVDEVRAVEIAERAFAAFNTGDYATWSEDWSPTMKAAIDEAAFLAFRETVRTALGEYVEVVSAERSSRSAGTYRWTFETRFERGTASLGFGFAEGSSMIEGVFSE